MWGQICREAAEKNWEHRGSSPLPQAPAALPAGDGSVGQWLSGLSPVGARCPQWEHAVPIPAGCVAWQEGGVPCQRWLWLSWGHGPGWELGSCRLAS